MGADLFIFGVKELPPSQILHIGETIKNRLEHEDLEIEKLPLQEYAIIRMIVLGVSFIVVFNSCTFYCC